MRFATWPMAVHYSQRSHPASTGDSLLAGRQVSPAATSSERWTLLYLDRTTRCAREHLAGPLVLPVDDVGSGRSRCGTTLLVAYRRNESPRQSTSRRGSFTRRGCCRGYWTRAVNRHGRSQPKMQSCGRATDCPSATGSHEVGPGDVAPA
jgi:hypothetical protein